MRDYKKGQKDSFPKYLLPLFFLSVLMLFLIFKTLASFSQKKIVSPLPVQSSINIPETEKELLEEIKKLINNQGTYSVYVYELNEKRGFGFNQETIFTAVSVNKIPILASLYFLAGKKEIDLNKKITIRQEDIQDYGTGIIRYDPPGRQYSLKTMARLMMEKSDNTASYILGKTIIGLDKIQELVDSWGLTQTDMKENKTSNKDMAQLLSLIYEEKTTSKALSKEMIDWMDDSDFENRLPALLPENIKVYHKIGTEIGIVHDVGIIELPGNPYYLGVLSSDVPNKEEAEDKIAQISKLIFEYQKLR